MECPILVWMLSLNRDVTTEVCVCVGCPPCAPATRRGNSGGSRSFSSLFTIVLQEYDKCYNLVRECSPHARIAYDCTSIESFRESGTSFSTSVPPSTASFWHFFSTLLHAGQIICQMLPLLMMRHRRISRTKWKDCETSSGKHWIEQVCLSGRLLLPSLIVQKHR